jgi:hypothetical protein
MPEFLAKESQILQDGEGVNRTRSTKSCGGCMRRRWSTARNTGGRTCWRKARGGSTSRFSMTTWANGGRVPRVCCDGPLQCEDCVWNGELRHLLG